MANTDWNEQIRQGVGALRTETPIEPIPGCQADGLKGLLNAIVDQISDADRRHTDTLHQMQERLSGIGREAKAMKPRVPDQFAAAFERIEAGMAELAVRISENGDVRPMNDDRGHRPAEAPELSASAFASAPVISNAEPPAALRSAAPNSAASNRRREEEAMRANAGIDTFDVIESSLPGNVSDPWDRDSAEALSGLYENGGANFAATTLIHEPAPTVARTYANTAALMGTSTAVAAPSVADHVWLEARFSDLSKRIDESLADIRPDQGFFGLNQRVEQFEQQLTSLIEGVATHGDVEGIRLIEAHVSELAGHMETAHQQLLRLDTIENHLAGIAGKLDDVHYAASLASGSETNTPDFDVDSIVRSAAEATARRFAELQPVSQPASQYDDMRPMLERFIFDSRQGEENTTALLDTLQQAMIRLLDRVDAMELANIQSRQASVQSAPQEYVREQVRFGVDPQRSSTFSDSEPVAALDAAVAAVANAKSISTPFTHAPDRDDDDFGRDAAPAAPSSATRSPEKLRQDFIADARRAKMRLSTEAVDQADASVTISRNEPMSPVAAARAQAATKSDGKSTAAPAKKTAVGSSSPRIKVMGLAAATLIAAGGAWYAMQGGSNAEQPVASGDAPAAAAAPATADASAAPGKEALSDSSAAAGNSTSPVAPTQAPSTAPAEKSSGELNLQEGTRGEIVTDGTATVALGGMPHGITVDTSKPMSALDLSRSKRQQAMATVSAQLGEAAAQPGSQSAKLVSLEQNAGGDVGGQPSAGLTSVAKGNMSQSSALDLPPITVGPLSLRMAAANGDASAQFEVGARLAEGKGTDQNFKDAAKWYQRSAAQGFAQAQYRLGTLYERGLGMTADPARAASWYKSAAEQGNIKAMHNLAVLSANQSKNSPDYATAAQWFEQAADHGLSDSQFNLAVLNENGLGVPQDMTLAYKWLSLAAKSGDKEAIKRRDILQGKLTADQLAKSEELVGAWKAKPADAQANDPRRAGEAWKKNPANGVNG